MKHSDKKIQKLLSRASTLTQEAIAAAHPKRRDKKAAAAEQLCRRAMALSREEIAAADSSMARRRGYNDLILSIYRCGALLFRMEKMQEAEQVLAEYDSLKQSVDGHPYGIACLAYYGSILCERGDYDAAATVLAEMMEAADRDKWGPAALADPYALCRAYGNAAIAFTYSDNGTGYERPMFSEPVNKLMQLETKGIDIGSDNLKKAAYFAASEQLSHNCYAPVSRPDTDDAVQFAELCIASCKEKNGFDWYPPAAMRLMALTAARDCRFADAVQLCKDTLEMCSLYKNGMGKSPFGSIQNIAADMNLLLGIMHYRASLWKESIGYFKAAVAALEADAQGRPLGSIGYIELETMLIPMTSAEKAAFAYQYMGLAMAAGEKDRFPLQDCVETIRLGIQQWQSIEPNEPYFHLAVSSDYHILSQLCERGGDTDGAERYDMLSKDAGHTALNLLHNVLRDTESGSAYMERVRLRRRLAMRLGLLELYGDYTRFEIMLSEQPYAEPEPVTLACLHLMMGDCCRVLGKYESAVDYFEAVQKHTFRPDGSACFDPDHYDFWEMAAVSETACLARMGQMPRARRLYREFTDKKRAVNNGSLSPKQLMLLAHTARNTGLNPAECAVYFREAAQAFDGEEEERFTSAELFNTEGICWYNASPEHDMPDDASLRGITEAQLTEQFAASELKAFENACARLSTCDPDHQHTIDLMPSLMSNIGECHMRAGDSDTALDDYRRAVSAFEKLFATDSFNEKTRPEQTPYVFQYGMCFKSMGEIYDVIEDDRACADALTKAVGILEKLTDSDTARNELAACLNALGCVKYRLGDYRGNITDVTRAISLKSGDKGSEISMAIMLKNRSDAYRELGDFKAMQSDLTRSLEMLDHSDMPDEMLNSFYSSHWFSMGVCQEGQGKNGMAADAYRRAARYMDASGDNGEEGINAYVKALCHYRRANCLYLRDEQEYYGALFEYNHAIQLIEGQPDSRQRNENLRQLLSSRGSLYEAFREIDLAKADYRRAESLKSSAES